MADRLYQISMLPRDEAEPHLLANLISSTIHNLAAAAEERSLPLALDWSDIHVNVQQGRHKGEGDKLRVEVSAPVL